MAVPLRFLLLVASVAFATTQAEAQVARPNVPPPAAASEEARGLARAMLDLEGVQTRLSDMLDATRQRYLAMLAARGDEPSQQVADAFERDLMPELRAGLAEYMSSLVDVYASSYTVDELRAILAFDLSPLGRRMIEQAPMIGRRITEAQMDWMERALAKALDQHGNALRQPEGKP